MDAMKPVIIRPSIRMMPIMMKVPTTCAPSSSQLEPRQHASATVSAVPISQISERRMRASYIWEPIHGSLIVHARTPVRCTS
jgi:hypothetical protein